MEFQILDFGFLVKRAFQASSMAFQAAFNYMRQITGDAAYENYVRHFRTGNCGHHGAGAPLTREQFYLDSLRRRYSGVSRCC